MIFSVSFLSSHRHVAVNRLIRILGDRAGPIGSNPESSPGQISGLERLRQSLLQFLNLFFRQNLFGVFFRLGILIEQFVDLVGEDEVLHLRLRHLPAALRRQDFDFLDRAVVVVGLVLDFPPFRRSRDDFRVLTDATTFGDLTDTTVSVVLTSATTSGVLQVATSSLTNSSTTSMLIESRDSREITDGGGAGLS